MSVARNNKIDVHGLWIGQRLSALELLSICSFIKHGYRFNLWLYEPLSHSLPQGCLVRDANGIIPFEKVFRYKNKSQFGTGKGSVSGFSDIFRYKLLHDIGGWWVDMDVTCLKPFAYEEPYFFRDHHSLPLVGNILKAPKGAPLMWKCYEEALATVDENNTDWHKPIEILARNVYALQLEKYIVSDVSNTDEWHKVERYVWHHNPLPSSWYFVHWCNEVWRTQGIEKNKPLYDSSYGNLLLGYGLLPAISPTKQLWHDFALRITRFWALAKAKLSLFRRK